MRVTPRSISGENGAARELSELTGIPPDECAEAIRKQLLASYRGEKDPETGFPVFAFRLHQFISRGDTVYASLEPEVQRHLTLNKQQFVPGDRARVLLPMAFCRECGQEYYVVRRRTNHQEGAAEWEPREVSDCQDGPDGEAGFLYASTDAPWPSDEEEIMRCLPEEWLEEHRGRTRVKPGRRKDLPSLTRVSTEGHDSGDGLLCHFLSAPFRFCLRCGVSYDFRQRSDFSKLTSLGTEGRSTATTILALSCIRHLRHDPALRETKANKLLSFTDNRQDASLQAGHFNDFLEIGLMRSALYRAVAAAGQDGIRHENLVQKVFAALNLPLTLYASDPAVRFQGLEDTNRAFRSVLGYRLYRDLKRGWRVTTPNLEQCGLLEIRYPALKEICTAHDVWQNRHPALVQADPETREKIARTLLDFMRRSLAVKVDYLNRDVQERVQQQSSQRLKSPWAIDENEKMESATVLYPRSRQQDDSGEIHTFRHAEALDSICVARRHSPPEPGWTLMTRMLSSSNCWRYLPLAGWSKPFAHPPARRRCLGISSLRIRCFGPWAMARSPSMTPSACHDSQNPGARPTSFSKATIGPSPLRAWAWRRESIPLRFHIKSDKSANTVSGKLNFRCYSARPQWN